MADMTVEQALAVCGIPLTMRECRVNWPGDSIEELAAALATLRAEIARLEKDAGRYRWLRENEWGSPIITLYAGDYENAQGDALDAAIDHAIQESSHEP